MLAINARLQQLVEEYAQVVTNLEQPTTTKNVSEVLSRLTEKIQHPRMPVDLMFTTVPTAEDISQLSTCLSPRLSQLMADKAAELEWQQELNFDGYPVCLRIKTGTNYRSTRVGDVTAPILVVVVPQLPENITDFELALLPFIEDRPALFFVHCAGFALSATMESRCRQEAAMFAQCALPNALPTPLFDKLFQRENQRLLAGFYDKALLQALEATNAIFMLLVEQEEKSMKARKALVKQQVSRLVAKGNISGSDLTAPYKNILQQSLGNFERGVNERLDQLFRPKTGKFWEWSEGVLEGFDQLEEAKRHSTNVIFVAPEYQEQLLREVREKLYQHLLSDLVALQDLCKALQQDISSEMEKTGVPAISLNIKHLTDAHISEALDSVVRIEKNFEVESRRKGIYEYFMAIRKYQMLFFIIASTFGLSFLRNMPTEFLIPGVIVLFGVGVVKVWRSVQQEREEERQKNNEKAKESLVGELKRIASEISRAWPKIISPHIKDQLTGVYAEVEQVVKAQAIRTIALENEEKKKLQRQNQGFENFERKITTIQRSRETIEKNLTRFKFENKQTIQQSLVVDRKPL